MKCGVKWQKTMIYNSKYAVFFSQTPLLHSFFLIFALVNYFIVTQSSKAKKATNAELLIYADKKYSNSPATAYLTYTSKVYNPPSSSSSGGSSGGGGGSSGGGGSHSF